MTSATFEALLETITNVNKARGNLKIIKTYKYKS